MKFLKRLFVFLLAILITLVAYLGIRGFIGYDELVSQQSVESVVNEVMSSPDFVPYEDLPSDLVRATVAIEDKRFFDHSGVDIIGLTRAVLSQMIPGAMSSGGSTITQQVAKNLYGMFDSSLDRKLVEFWLAKDLEKHYSKSDILTIYVNIINYGDNHMGINQASYGYFGVAPEDLTIAQCSLLAGLPQSPSNFQLSTGFQAAKTRQRDVLEAMVDSGYLGENQVDVIWNMAV